MAHRTHGFFAGCLFLVAATACAPGKAVPRGSGGGGGSSGVIHGDNVCNRAAEHMNACLGKQVADSVPDAQCTGVTACVDACWLAAPCDVLDSKVSPALQRLDLCEQTCMSGSTNSVGGASGSGCSTDADCAMGQACVSGLCQGNSTGSSSTQSSGSGGSGSSSSHSSSSHASSSSSGSSTGSGGDTCPFSPGSIDCDQACSHYLSYCDTCGGCTFQTQANCVAGCQYEVGIACDSYIEVWGCLESSSSCSAYDSCFIDTYCSQYPSCG